MDFDFEYQVSSTYTFDIIITGNNQVIFRGYDDVERDYHTFIKELEKVIIKLISPNPFGKKSLYLNIGYSSDTIPDRGLLAYMIDSLIFKYKTSNIRIIRGISNLNFNA